VDAPMGNKRAASGQQGFTMMQMLTTLAIISVISTVGVLGVRTARAEFRLQSSARLFASYVEKARADSIRRHATGGQQSSVETFGPGTTTYAVTMDYGDGTVETRNFNLESGLVFATAAQKVTFDWRGRITAPCDITKACVFQVQSDVLGRNIPVDVSGSGDITVGEQHFPDQLIPEIAMSDVGGDVDTPSPTPPIEIDPDPDESPDPIDEGGDTSTPTPTATPTPTPNGNGNGNGNDGDPGNPNNGPTPPVPTPTPPGATPTPTPTPMPQCVTTLSPSTLSLSQSDPSKQSGTAIFAMTSATGTRIISASLAGNGNSLNLGLSLVRIDGSGSSTLTVSTKNGAGNRGTFLVNVATDPACGSAPQLTVSVSN
jgi:hypothetical protein